MASSQLVKVLFIVLSIQAVAFAIRYRSLSCVSPQRPDNGGYYASTYKSRYPIWRRIRFFCNSGYKLEGSSSTVCIYSNKRAHWLHPSPICRPIRCPSLSDPMYGSVQVTDHTPGSTALYKCGIGYKLVGHSIRKCYNGYWTGKEPVCQTFQPCGGLGTPLSTSAGLVTCSATRQCPPMYFCHNTDHFSVCCPVTPPISTTTQAPITVATTTPATPFSGSGAGEGEGDNEMDIDGSGSGSGATDQEEDEWQQIQIIE